METIAMDVPRVYVACLAAYNNGILHGEWIDATDADVMREEVAAMLSRSPITAGAEEYAIHDHDGFRGIPIGEYEPIGHVARVAALVEEHGEPFAVWVRATGWDLDDDCIGDRFTEAYLGERTALDYAYDYVEETGMLRDVDETVARYFDYQAFARDLLFGGDVFESDGYLFNGYV